MSTGKQLRWSTFLIKCLACNLPKQDIILGVFLWILRTFPGQVFGRTPCDLLIYKSAYHQDRHLQYLYYSVSVLLAWNFRIHYLINLFDRSNFSGKTCISDLVITWYFQNLERINIQVKQVLVIFRLEVSLRHRCFPVNYEKKNETAFSQNTCKAMLLNRNTSYSNLYNAVNSS